MKEIINILFKLLNVLMDPLFLLLLLFVLTLLTVWKQKKKGIWICGGLLFFHCILIGSGLLGKWTANYLQRGYVDRYDPARLPHPRMVVVLGGGITTFASLETPSVFSNPRVMKAYELFHQSTAAGIQCRIIASGLGTGKTHYSEAALFRQVLLRMGVPDSCIILEEKSHSTYENARYTGVILKKYPERPVYLVTSGFHEKSNGHVSVFRSGM